MTLTLHPPLSFSQPGQRDNNEDSVCPAVGTASPDTRVFLVCDGVGGGASGEIASRIVADGMAAYFNAQTGPSDDETVAAALHSVEQALDAYLEQHSEAAGMATTLTLLHLHEQGATVAHVGDSRVYCCRDGRVVFKTDDHKLVNEWVKNGILTPEQALDHPQHNVITRAVRGTAKPAQADVALLQGLRPGDYFFLCTDGVLETLTTERLCAVLAADEPDEAKITAIRQGCDGRTQDNYSACLIRINTVDVPADKAVTSAPAAQPAPVIQPVSVSAQPVPLASHTPVAPVQPVAGQAVSASPVLATVHKQSTVGNSGLPAWFRYGLPILIVVAGFVVWSRFGHQRPLALPVWHQPNRPHHSHAPTRPHLPVPPPAPTRTKSV